MSIWAAARVSSCLSLPTFMPLLLLGKPCLSGLIVIPLARFPSFSSLPPIPVLAAPAGCVTAQLIYLQAKYNDWVRGVAMQRGRTERTDDLQAMQCLGIIFLLHQSQISCKSAQFPMLERGSCWPEWSGREAKWDADWWFGIKWIIGATLRLIFLISAS